MADRIPELVRAECVSICQDGLDWEVEYADGQVFLLNVGDYHQYIGIMYMRGEQFIHDSLPQLPKPGLITQYQKLDRQRGGDDEFAELSTRLWIRCAADKIFSVCDEFLNGEE